MFYQVAGAAGSLTAICCLSFETFVDFRSQKSFSIPSTLAKFFVHFFSLLFREFRWILSASQYFYSFNQEI